MRFEEEVWAEIRKVPKGRLTTYKIIAEKIGTSAYRAVGTACGRNPDLKNTHCYRVIATDGRIGGYALGIRKKIMLLKKDGFKIRKNKVLDYRSYLI